MAPAAGLLDPLALARDFPTEDVPFAYPRMPGSAFPPKPGRQLSGDGESVIAYLPREEGLVDVRVCLLRRKVFLHL